MKVTYSHNNSGGYDWLKPEDWEALEQEGWDVEWLSDEYMIDKSKERWAYEASKEFPTIGMAIAEWEYITSQNANAAGCECCGPPHSFYSY